MESHDRQDAAQKGPEVRARLLRHFLAIGFSVASWFGSITVERLGVARADHWGIYVGEWAPTFFALGLALANYEHPDVDVELEAESLHPVTD